MHMGGSDNTGEGYQVGGASCSPAQLSARRDWEPAYQEGGDGGWNGQPKPKPVNATLPRVPKTPLPAHAPFGCSRSPGSNSIFNNSETHRTLTGIQPRNPPR